MADPRDMNAIPLSPRKIGRIAIFVAFVVTVVAASTEAGVRFTAPNLVQNGGAESDPAANGSQVVPPTGWDTTGAFTVGRYGAEGFPPAPAGGGSNLFAGGPGAQLSVASQEVDPSSRTTRIDAGLVQATLSALLGGWEGQNDSATVRAVFMNDNGLVLDTFAIGPVTAADRGYKSKLLRDSRSESVPAQTRSIRVVIAARRASGNYNDGYADNVSLTLSATKPVRAHYRFGFRIFDRASDLSAGSHGQFTTEGQPDSTGATKIVSLTANDLPLGWTYRGKPYLINFRFLSGGTYNRTARFLVLQLTVRNSNVSDCKRGTTGAMAIHGDGNVILVFCGRRLKFVAPSRATSWVKPR